jgi:hypothetical protein
MPITIDERQRLLQLDRGQLGVVVPEQYRQIMGPARAER